MRARSWNWKWVDDFGGRLRSALLALTALERPRLSAVLSENFLSRTYRDKMDSEIGFKYLSRMQKGEWLNIDILIDAVLQLQKCCKPTVIKNENKLWPARRDEFDGMYWNLEWSSVLQSRYCVSKYPIEAGDMSQGLWKVKQ